MAAFTHVLCPIDFSETSRRALELAGALAARYGARLTAMHVLSPSGEVPMAPALGDSVVTLPAPTPDQVRVELASEVEGLEIAPKVSDVAVERGRAHEVVLAHIGDLGVDLLVLGTHGRSGFQRLFLGSVAEKLVRTAPCPVLTVPPAAETRATGRFARVLCPSDLSAASSRALEMALDLARDGHGHVTVLHAIEYLDPGTPDDLHVESPAYRQRLVEHYRQRLHEQVADATRPGDDVDEVLAVNRAYREILDRAEALPADLIVMGAHGHRTLELMFYGSTTQHVVRRAACPVLTVRA